MEGLRADIHHSQASPFCEAPSIKQVAARPESRRFYQGKAHVKAISSRGQSPRYHAAADLSQTHGGMDQFSASAP